ncbi:MAG: FixH family protein [Saprospiraceae bacterium]|nr:FixH family protein [Saprospiraceae bacterium]
MNWGTGIVIFFIVFATSMVFAVVSTTKYPPQMVQKDYYALDINYQAHLEKKQHAAALASPPQARFEAADKSIQVLLPEGMNARKGTVKCYRSATTRDDVLTPFENAASISIPAATFPAGRWHLELDWEDQQGKPYFWQTTLTL